MFRNDDNDNDNDDESIDEKVIEEIDETPAEDPFLTEYMSAGGGDSDELDFVKDWFPKEDEWKGKTDISAEQARLLGLIRQMPEMFPELEEMGDFLTELTDDYEKYLTSVDGMSREQQKEIMRTMFGGVEKDAAESQSRLMDAMSKEITEDDE